MTNYIAYGELMFDKQCPHCKRFVKADNAIPYETNYMDDIRFVKPNATCKKCGRVKMEFVGVF